MKLYFHNLILMSQIVLYVLHSTLILSFYINIVMTLYIYICIYIYILLREHPFVCRKWVLLAALFVCTWCDQKNQVYRILSYKLSGVMSTELHKYSNWYIHVSIMNKTSLLLSFKTCLYVYQHFKILYAKNKIFSRMHITMMGAKIILIEWWVELYMLKDRKMVIKYCSGDFSAKYYDIHVLLGYHRALSWAQFFFYYKWMTIQYIKNQHCSIFVDDAMIYVFGRYIVKIESNLQ